MNLHPIFIHFPIAFLTLYGVLELIRFKSVLEKPYWFYIKAVLVVAGALGALVAVLTGAITSDWTIGGPRIFAMHQVFAISTLILSVGVAKAYLFTWFKPNRFSNFWMRPQILIVLAILVLIGVTLTGGLGAAMTRGTQFDPFMAPVFKLLGVY